MLRTLKTGGIQAWKRPSACILRAYATARPPQYIVPEDVTDFASYSRRDGGLPVEESVAASSPQLKALHARLGLPSEFSLSTLARALLCRSASKTYADNYGMQAFGRRLLEFYVHAHFTTKYPRLPHEILRHLIQTYIRSSSLAIVGRTWGIEEDGRPEIARLLSEEGDREIIGKLAYVPQTKKVERGVQELVESPEAVGPETAMGMAVRAVIAGVYAHSGLDAAREFVYSHIIRPKPVDVANLLSFQQPTRELAVLCAREGLEAPMARLMAETGRFSRAPVFVVGVFSGSQKLGEGQGSSLKEAKTRAAVNALKGWYLYSPLEEDSKHDHGVVIV
uniref:Large ribosomal subunit protein mL44 n=1 Tax=Blastobotrys adeninivorans TaxID=409370 RepID=A0A060T3N2_BLAAD